MPDTLSNTITTAPEHVSVPLANPPDKAPGRTDVSYRDESTPQSRADKKSTDERREQEHREAVDRALQSPVDSLAATHASEAADTIPPWTAATVSEINGPVALGRERGASTHHEPGYRRGLEGEARPLMPGYDSGTMTLLLAVFVLLAFNFRHYTTFLKTFAQDLWSVRQRGNVFDDRTVSEMRITASLLVLACVCEGALAFSLFHYLGVLPHDGPDGVFPLMLAGGGAAAAYYVWQVFAYTVTGYAFGTKTARIQWLKGFNASQALLGLTLVTPALIALFNPGMVPGMVATAGVLYVVARVIFISKGFRLFYDNFGSLLYFILYLCTLEIAPLFAIAKICAESGRA